MVLKPPGMKIVVRDDEVVEFVAHEGLLFKRSVAPRYSARER